HTDHGTWTSRAVINATGSWRRPFMPFIPGGAQFTGTQLHTTRYRSRDQFRGARVLVVGGGNSGAQIAADLLPTASAVTWVTRRPPRFLPDEIDGRALFQLATRHVQGTDDTENPGGIAALGDIVVTPPIRHARDAGLLTPSPMFCRFTPTGVQWSTGDQVALDAVIWCTGFRPDLGHLQGLNLHRNTATPATTTDPPTQSRDHTGLFFLGYGDWCGPASATLIGVGAPARATSTAAAQQARPEPRPDGLVLSRLRRLVRPGLPTPDRSRRPRPCHQHRRSPTSPPISITSRAVSSGDSHAIERAKNPPAEANKSSDPHLRL